MNFKNWAIGILALLAMIVVFSACSDDDDNGPAFNAEGKRLVSRINGQDPNDPDDTEEVSFKYNGDGQITAIDWKYEYYSDEKDRKCTDKEYITFSVSGNKLKVVDKYEDGENSDNNDTYIGNFILNEQEYVESGDDEWDGDKHSYEFIYEGDYLKKETYTENGRNTRIINYIWEDGDLLSATYQSKPTYTNKINKANIDFVELENDLLGYNYSYLELTDFLGKHNKHLVKSIDGATYIYEYDDEGYVIKFTVKYSQSDSYVYKVSYN